MYEAQKGPKKDTVSRFLTHDLISNVRCSGSKHHEDRRLCIIQVLLRNKVGVCMNSAPHHLQPFHPQKPSILTRSNPHQSKVLPIIIKRPSQERVDSKPKSQDTSRVHSALLKPPCIRNQLTIFRSRQKPSSDLQSL